MPAAIRSGFDSLVLPANDDGFTALQAIGFNVNFFGQTYSSLYVNNNGNLTFNSPLSTFTPFGLTGATSIPIIAPFFADVDTRGSGSGLLKYGHSSVNSHPAFGATWNGVGYYGFHANLLNSFQVILIDRSDTGTGNFDIEFNYDRIEWETGDASGGLNGMGGSSARAGYSNGSGQVGSFFELPGSGVHGGLLGSASTGLANNSLNSNGVLGRYIFSARSGSLPVNLAPVLQPIGPQVVDEQQLLTFTAHASDPDGNAVSYSQQGAPAGASINPTTGQFSWTPTEAQGPGTYTFTVRATDNGNPAQSDEQLVTVVVNEVNRGPTVNPITDQTVNEGSTVSFMATASDPDLPPNQLTFSLVAPPSGATIDPVTGQFLWTPTDNGDYAVAVQVTDNGAPALSHTRIVNIRVNNVAPTATINGTPDTSSEGATIPLNGSATDPGADVLTYSWNVSKNGQSYAMGTSTNFGFKPDDNGTYVISLTVSDGDGGVTTVTKSITVSNLDPVPTITGYPATGTEGTAITLGSTVDDPGMADTYTLAWSVTKNGVMYINVSGNIFSNFSFTPDDDGTYVVTLTATDDDGGIGSVSKSITVNNVAPTVSQVAALGSLQEGTPVTVTVSATDPGGVNDPLAYEFDFDNDGIYEVGPQASPSAAHTFGDNGTYTVKVRVTDGDGGVTTSSSTFIVSNVAPVIASMTAPAGSNEGDGLSFHGAATDVPTDPLSYSWNFGDGSPAVTGDSASHTFADNGTYTVTLTVNDGDGGQVTETRTVTVNNVAPTVSAITAPLDPVAVNTAINASATFADVGVKDTHTATWDWGDGTTSTGTVTESGGSGSVAGSHAYMAAGVYTVTLTVTDKDGGTVSTLYRYVVIYDAGAGFVTGGGWINSPAGAYSADPTLAGRANFGFVSKYQRGSSVPTGQTEFQFKLGGLDFHSTSYDWLVIAGAKAQYKGSGTINGSGNYKFMLTAIDGQQSGGGGVDKFRIKIWNADTGTIVYDNQMNGSDTADPTIGLAGGSIQIHS